MTLGPGVRLGRYELLCMIGAGGMASVWAARVLGSRGFERIVAVKVLLPFLEEDPEMQRMFIQEAEIAASIQHPNVCPVFDLGEHNGTMYMVMEWVDGDTVGALIAGGVGPVRPEVAARIIADAAAGLAGAFGARTPDGRFLAVLHRDISPNNILIGHDGQIKLSDFGIAKVLTARRVSNVSLVRGKPSYMAPERAAGEAHDHRADVFSLGCVFFELLTCESIHTYLSSDASSNSLAFDPEHTAEVGLLSGSSEIGRGLDAELLQILLRSTSPHPDERFATADEMRMTIESWLVARGLGNGVDKLVIETVRSRIGSRIEGRRAAIRDAAHAIGKPAHPAPEAESSRQAERPPVSYVSARRSTTSRPNKPRQSRRRLRELSLGFAIGFVMVAVVTVTLLVVGRRGTDGQAIGEASAKTTASTSPEPSSRGDATPSTTEPAKPSTISVDAAPPRPPAPKPRPSSTAGDEPPQVQVPTNPYAR